MEKAGYGAVELTSLQHPKAQGQFPLWSQHALESAQEVAHHSEVNGRQVRRPEWCQGLCHRSERPQRICKAWKEFSNED